MFDCDSVAPQFLATMRNLTPKQKYFRDVLVGIGGDKFAVDIDGRVRAMSKEEATDWLDFMENTK